LEKTEKYPVCPHCNRKISFRKIFLLWEEDHQLTCPYCGHSLKTKKIDLQLRSGFITGISIGVAGILLVLTENQPVFIRISGYIAISMLIFTAGYYYLLYRKLRFSSDE
jgi:CXXC-20-CXXC protein